MSSLSLRGGSVISFSTLTILAGGIATLAIYSFLIQENPFYRFFEHLFIGIAAGFIPIYTIKGFLYPQVFEPMFGLDIITYPDGTLSKEYNPLYLFFLAPIVFGLFYYTIYFQKIAWLSKLAIGFALGYSGALAFKGFFAEMLPQLESSFKPLVVRAESGFDWGASIDNMIFVFTLLAVMYYFFFTYKRSGKPAEVFSTSGRLLMMVCFGAFFGSTVMARMALLVERMQFLLTEWLTTLRDLI